jgi:dolichyl-phosphate beta-glucosyltransferase
MVPALSVVIPAYNEEARLGGTLQATLAYLDAHAPSFELIVVDDGSTDKTAKIVEAVQATRPEVKLLSYGGNRGKGYAVRFGMLRASGQRILFCDADLATPIEEIEKLNAALDEGYDIAIGSRDVKGSQLIKHQSFLREHGGKAFNQLVQRLTVPGIHDTQCGFKLFTRSAAQSVFSRCQIDHFAFDVELLYIARRLFGLRIAEVPIRWAHQEGSKVRFWRDGFRMVSAVVRIRCTRYARVSTAAELGVR